MPFCLLVTILGFWIGIRAKGGTVGPFCIWAEREGGEKFCGEGFCGLDSKGDPSASWEPTAGKIGGVWAWAGLEGGVTGWAAWEEGGELCWTFGVGSTAWVK